MTGDASEAIVISRDRLGRNFTQMPDFMSAILAPDVYWLGSEVLRISRERQTDEVHVSTRYLRERTGYGQSKVIGMKNALCAALPTVFVKIPGDAGRNQADAIVIDRLEFLLMHARYAAEREAKAAQRERRAPRAMVVECGGRRVTVTAEATEVAPITRKLIPTDADAVSAAAEVTEEIASVPKVGENHNSLMGPLPETDLFGNPTVPSQPNHKKESKTLTREQLENLRDIWNANKHERFATKRALPTGADLKGLQAAFAARQHDFAALLEDWIYAVQQVARLGNNPRVGHWGEIGKDRAPAMSNLIPNIDKHAEAGRAIAERTAITTQREEIVFERPEEI
ncbi:hypothetical protein [Deinococcus fonticola]|uniref:hypothetical protein n=1 Tax=Deinococcus fonticola TaxID=2528713 RepID=UPI001074A61A|nr:hypothetical protein [Deinococcus fonticola]